MADGLGLVFPVEGGFDEGLDVFDFGGGGDAVAEVQDVAAGVAHGGEEVGGFGGNLSRGGCEEFGVEVALEGDVRRQLVAELAEVFGLVDAEDFYVGDGSLSGAVLGGVFAVKDERGFAGEGGGDLADVLEGGAFVGVGVAEEAAVGVKELEGVGAGGSLPEEVGGDGAG